MNPRERFKQWRKRSKLSADAVAVMLGCSRSYVYELEGDYSGRGVIPSRRMAKKIQEKTRISARSWDSLVKAAS